MYLSLSLTLNVSRWGRWSVMSVCLYLTPDVKSYRQYLKTNPRDARRRQGFIFIHSSVCRLFLDQPLTKWKRYRTEILHTHYPTPYMYKYFSFVFSTEARLGPLASKNCRVTVISAYLLDCLVPYFIVFLRCIFWCINFLTRPPFMKMSSSF